MRYRPAMRPPRNRAPQSAPRAKQFRARAVASLPRVRIAGFAGVRRARARATQHKGRRARPKRQAAREAGERATPARYCARFPRAKATVTLGGLARSLVRVVGDRQIHRLVLNFVGERGRALAVLLERLHGELVVEAGS